MIQQIVLTILIFTWLARDILRAAPFLTDKWEWVGCLIAAGISFTIFEYLIWSI